MAYSCAQTTGYRGGASEIRVSEVLRESERLRAEAEAARLEGKIGKTIHNLVSASARIDTLPPNEESAQGIKLKIAKSLESIDRRLIIVANEEWVERHSNRFELNQELTESLPAPSFTLLYRDEATLLPVAGLGIWYEFLKGGGRLVNPSPTNRQGEGGYRSAEIAPSEVEPVVKLGFEYTAEGYTHRFAHTSGVFVYPQPSLYIEIKNGERMSDFLKRMERRRITTRKAMRALVASEIYEAYPHIPPPHIHISRFEGLFKPGRYRFLKTRIEVLNVDDENREVIALRNARTIISELLAHGAERSRSAQRVRGLSGYEQLVLASIVEKEAASNKDYDRIASVFHNRLRMGSQLASCPSVEYALGYHRPFLTKADISIASPYNLYLRVGLPPTPICFFSDEALEAVRNPLESRLLYFVFDWTLGKIYFARLYKDHLKNAETARNNYVEKHGVDSLFKVYYDKFYEE
jgi:uncharacterized YceG family protein